MKHIYCQKRLYLHQTSESWQEKSRGGSEAEHRLRTAPHQMVKNLEKHQRARSHSSKETSAEVSDVVDINSFHDFLQGFSRIELGITSRKLEPCQGGRVGCGDRTARSPPFLFLLPLLKAGAMRAAKCQACPEITLVAFRRGVCADIDTHYFISYFHRAYQAYPFRLKIIHFPPRPQGFPRYPMIYL